jgi:hypothetical protein
VANSWRHMYSWRRILPLGFWSSCTSSHTSTADCHIVSAHQKEVPPLWGGNVNQWFLWSTLSLQVQQLFTKLKDAHWHWRVVLLSWSMDHCFLESEHWPSCRILCCHRSSFECCNHMG